MGLVGTSESKIRTGQVGLKWIKIRVQPRSLFIKPDFWARSNPGRVEPKIYNLFVRSTFWDLFENFLKIANFSYLSKLGVVFRIWAVMNFFDMFVQWIFQSKLMVRTQLTLKWHFDTIFKFISDKTNCFKFRWKWWNQLLIFLSFTYISVWCNTQFVYIFRRVISH